MSAAVKLPRKKDARFINGTPDLSKLEAKRALELLDHAVAQTKASMPDATESEIRSYALCYVRGWLRESLGGAS